MARTLPKMFNRQNPHTSDKSTTHNASTNNNPASTQPDYEDTYFISESEFGDFSLFADEVIEVEEEVVEEESSPFQKTNTHSMGKAHSKETTTTHAQVAKEKAQAAPPLPPRRNQNQAQSNTAKRPQRDMGVDKETHQRSAAGRSMDSQNRMEVPALVNQSNHQMESTGTEDSQKVTKKKRYRSKQFTESDRKVLEAVHWLAVATVNHVSFAIGQKPVTVQPKLRKLANRDFLRVNTEDDMTTYTLTKLGLSKIGRANEKTVVGIAQSTYQHRNQINTAICAFKLGGHAFRELMYQHQLTQMDSKNRVERKKSVENHALTVSQQALKQKPEHLLSDTERKILSQSPKPVHEVAEPVRMKPQSSSPLLENPQATFPERLIQLSISDTGESECIDSWNDECRSWLSNQSYPVKVMGDSSVTPADRKAMYTQADGMEWLFRHWNTRNDFKKRHMPDGVVLMPHWQDPQGNIVPRSWWLEIETNRKSDNSEVVRVIEQAFDHPLTRGVIYMTRDRQVANSIKKAKATVKQRLTHRYQQYEGMNYLQAVEAATKYVDENCLLLDIPVVNPRKNTQFWG